MVTIIFILLAIWAVIDGFIKNPTNYWGLPTFLDKKINLVYNEGLGYTYPLFSIFGKMLYFSQELQIQVFAEHDSVKVTSKDGLVLILESSVEWTPDPDNLLVFSKTSDATIKDGIKDAIEDLVGQIAGTLEGENFKKKREAVKFLIESTLRLSRRPDFYLNKDNLLNFPSYSSQSFEDYLDNLQLSNPESLVNKLSAHHWKVPINDEGELDILEFYTQNVSRIVLMINFAQNTQEKSEIEKKYGISVLGYNLAQVNFSEAIEKSMEEKVKASNKIEANTQLHEKKMKMMQDMIDAGVDPNQASNDVDAMLGIAEKQVVAGGGTPLTILNSKK